MRSNPSAVLRRAFCALFLLVPVALAPPAHAQQGALSVTVRAEGTGRPLPGAQVILRGTGGGGTADRAGRVSLEDLPAGARQVEVRYLGYAPARALVMVEPGRTTTLEFSLSLQPIALAEVRVRARRSTLYSNGFFQRKQGGFGTFLTREEIESMRPRYLSDVLRRVAGVSLAGTDPGRSRASMRGPKSGAGCPVQYYVDGVLTAMFNADEVSARDVEGLEVYKGAATVPPAFNRGTAMCGVIVIWTRVE